MQATQVMTENCGSLLAGFDATPGLSSPCDEQIQPVEIVTQENRERIITAVRQIILDEVDTRVQEKADQLWLRGKQMLSSSQIKHKEKAQELTEQLAECQKKQQALEAESEKLKQVLTGLASHFSMLGATFGCDPGTCGGLALESDTVASTMCPSPDVAPELFSPGVFTPSTETAAALNTAAAAAIPFPEIPDFPFAAPQCLTPATPLSLAETIAGPQSPQTLSLANSLTPTSSNGTGWTPGQCDGSTYTFSFTLRKADGADLGLNVSHHEFDRVLRVEGVRAEGAVEAWNRQCAGTAMADKVLLPGDTIISVNQVVHEPKAMLEECRDKQLLKFTIVRAHSSLVPPVATPTVATTNASSTLRAEASEFVPFSAATTTTGLEDGEESQAQLVDYSSLGDTVATPA